MFTKHLKQLRNESGLTQKQVANKLSISQSAYAQWETGKLNPKKETIQMFADFFNVSYDFLAGNTDIKNPEPYSKPEMHFRKAVSDLKMTKEQEEQFQKDIINFIEQRKNILKGR